MTPRAAAAGPAPKRWAIDNLKECKLSERMDNLKHRLERMEKRLDNFLRVSLNDVHQVDRPPVHRTQRLRLDDITTLKDYGRTTFKKSIDDRFTALKRTFQQLATTVQKLVMQLANFQQAWAGHPQQQQP